MLTDEQVEEIRTRCEKATPGPWKNDGPDRFSSDEPWVHVVDGPTIDTLILARLPCEFPDNRAHDERLGLCGNASNNAEFVAHARTDIPALLADRKEMQKLLREAVELLQHYRQICPTRDSAAETKFFSLQQYGSL